MIFVPYGCDAPLYHPPVATIGLIVANVAAYFASVFGVIDPFDGWILVYGVGLHPIEWVLSIFMHGDIWHLIGNMFFLWTFGLVTEGKLGWWRFLACYFAIGVGESALEQLLMLNNQSGGVSLGASSAIFGLMAMACVWAPLNEVRMFGWIFWYFFSFDITIAMIAAIYVGMQIFFLSWMTALPFSATAALESVLHLLGVGLGAALGVVLLVRKKVDCERWDLFTVLRGDQGQPTAEELAPPAPDKVAAHRDRQADEAKKKILAYLHIKQAPLAHELLLKTRDLRIPVELDQKDQLRLIVGLDQHKKWADAAPIMAQYIEDFPEGSEAVRLRLAQICLVELQRPARTLELLEPLSRSSITEKQEQLRRKMAAVAKQQLAEGVLELDDVV